MVAEERTPLEFERRRAEREGDLAEKQRGREGKEYKYDPCSIVSIKQWILETPCEMGSLQSIAVVEFKIGYQAIHSGNLNGKIYLSYAPKQ